jgi:cephalosporin hydroxylase
MPTFTDSNIDLRGSLETLHLDEAAPTFAKAIIASRKAFISSSTSYHPAKYTSSPWYTSRWMFFNISTDPSDVIAFDYLRHN